MAIVGNISSVYRYKLITLNGTNFGEIIRYLLIYGGVLFDDNVISNNDWEKLSPITPFGQLPVLEIDGKMYSQTKAIGRYLGEEFGLVGTNSLGNLEIDGVVDIIDDLEKKMELYKVVNVTNNLRKIDEKFLVNLNVSFYLEKLENFSSSEQFLVADKLTWADFYFTVTIERINGILNENLLLKFPRLLNVWETIVNIPSIRHWRKNRRADFSSSSHIQSKINVIFLLLVPLTLRFIF